MNLLASPEAFLLTSLIARGANMLSGRLPRGSPGALFGLSGLPLVIVVNVFLFFWVQTFDFDQLYP